VCVCVNVCVCVCVCVLILFEGTVDEDQFNLALRHQSRSVLQYVAMHAVAVRAVAVCCSVVQCALNVPLRHKSLRCP